MAIWLDVIFVLIVAISIFIAMKKGFVRSLIEVIGYVLAVVLAFSFSGVVAEFLYDNFLNETIVNTIETAILQNSSNVINELPSYIKMLIPSSNADLNSVLQAGSINVETISEQVYVTIRPIAVNVIKTIATFVIFAICLIISRILAKLLNSMFKGVVLGTANKLLGGVLGAVKGVVIGSVFSLCVYLATVLPSVSFLDFATDALYNSFICKSVVNFILSNF